jgi:hypothetical protein
VWNSIVTAPESSSVISRQRSWSRIRTSSFACSTSAQPSKDTKQGRAEQSRAEQRKQSHEQSHEQSDKQSDKRSDKRSEAKQSDKATSDKTAKQQAKQSNQ